MLTVFRKGVLSVVNIYKIAEVTGLSASTVARALSGRGYCSEKSRKIVEEAAKDLDYTPMQAAKTLRSRQTQKIMFCIPDICNPYYFSMIRGVNEVLESNKYYSMLSHTNHDAEKELELIDMMERFADGMILVSFDFTKRLIEKINKCRRPVVIMNLYNGNGLNNFDCVYVDHIKAVHLAAEHLIQRGHRQIAFLGGALEEQTGAERYSGYRIALEEYRIPVDPSLIVIADYQRETAKIRFGEFLDSGSNVTAVLAGNDLMGMGAVDACREHGLRIPEDISIVTLDNTDLTTCSFPKITSVNMNQELTGKTAADLILERILQKRAAGKNVSIEPSLEIRDSVLTLSNEKIKSSFNYIIY